MEKREMTLVEVPRIFVTLTPTQPRPPRGLRVTCPWDLPATVTFPVLLLSLTLLNVLVLRDSPSLQ